MRFWTILSSFLGSVLHVVDLMRQPRIKFVQRGRVGVAEQLGDGSVGHAGLQGVGSEAGAVGIGDYALQLRVFLAKVAEADADSVAGPRLAPRVFEEGVVPPVFASNFRVRSRAWGQR